MVRVSLLLGVILVCSACEKLALTCAAGAALITQPREFRLEPYTSAEIAIESWSCAEDAELAVEVGLSPCWGETGALSLLDAKVTLRGTGCLQSFAGEFGSAAVVIDDASGGCLVTDDAMTMFFAARHPDRNELPVQAADARVSLRAGGDEIALDVEAAIGRFELEALDDLTEVPEAALLRFRLPSGVDVLAAENVEVLSTFDQPTAEGDRYHGFELERINGDVLEIRAIGRYDGPSMPPPGSGWPIEGSLTIVVTMMSERLVACEGVETCTLSIRHVWSMRASVLDER